MSNKTTPDLQLSQRVANAIEKRNQLNTRVAGFQAEVRLAKKSADEARAEAEQTYEVKSLSELSAKAKAIYTEDVANVEAFEKAVAEFEARVLAAEKIKAEVNGQ